MKRDTENQANTVVPVLRMMGEKIFHNTGESTKSVYKGQVNLGVTINVVSTLVNRRIEP